MDHGLWITWYDLPEAGRADYLSWLHEAHLPRLLERPGYLWAAHYASVPKGANRTTGREGALRHTDDPGVPTGDRYILIVGAAHANVFGDPVPGALSASLPEADRRMLALRVAARVNVMTETARVEGPEAAAYREGLVAAPCIQIGSFNCAWQDEEELLAWYAAWRLPAMRTLPGCIRTRKLASVAGWAKHALLYEFVSVAARFEHFLKHEDARPDRKAWSDRMVAKLTHAPGSANLAVRTWPPVKDAA